MSSNLVDFTTYEQLDCRAESSHSIRYAQPQEYLLSFQKLHDRFAMSLTLKFNNYSQGTFSFLGDLRSEIQFTNHYESSLFEEMQKVLENTIGRYYQIIRSGKSQFCLRSVLTGQCPSPTVPQLLIESDDLCFELEEIQKGRDCFIFIKKQHRNIIHIPRTTMGPNYKSLKIGDRILLIDSLSDYDVALSRQVVGVELSASCTCDVITLDRDIDRIEENEKRLPGLGLRRPPASATSYCADFEKVTIFKRKENYRQILMDRSTEETEGKVYQCFDPSLLSVEAAKEIVTSVLSSSSNPWLADQKVQFYGCAFSWKRFKHLLEPIYSMFSNYLEDECVVLTSNKNRPDYLVHIDGFPESVFKASLTWPVDQCSEGENLTIWYDVTYKGNPICSAHERNRTIKNKSGISMVEIGRYLFDSELFNPIIFRHDRWHTVYNMSTSEDVRALLQWRFKPEFPWEKIIELTQEIHN